MKDLNTEAFITLFKEAYRKCFGASLQSPMSETESRHFSNTIFEATGLVIGAKSIKNYSSYVLNSEEGKPENPSVATLDTMSRYVLDAPFTDETKRKAHESHYPFWFRYKSRFSGPETRSETTAKSNKKFSYTLIAIAAVLITITVILFCLYHKKNNSFFVENFHSLSEDTLAKHGWFIQSKDSAWWKKREENPAGLTLYTLRGDNWPDSGNVPLIKNLLLQKLPSDDFSAEVHMNNFVPQQEWQQAGILIMEDTTFSSKCLRLSIAYNDFFGGYNRPKEIILQAISTGGPSFTKPEEIAHIPLYTFQSGHDSLLQKNMQNTALRVEKNGKHFRFLYSSGSGDNFAFKEAFVRDMDVKPLYIGIFALEGFVNNTAYMPVHFSFFSLVNNQEN